MKQLTDHRETYLSLPLDMAEKKKWIQEAIKKPGALRKALGAKAGKPIAKGKLEKAAGKKGVTGRRARLAQTLRKLGRK